MSRKIIYSILLLLLFFNIAQAKILTIYLDYSDGQFSVNRTGISDGMPSGYIKDATPFMLELININNSVIESRPLIIPRHIITEKFGDEPEFELINQETKQIFFFFEYDFKIAFLYIYNGSELLMNHSLLRYNKCNLDFICSAEEDIFTCPEDCETSEKDGICHNIEDGLCKKDADCTLEDPDCIINQVNFNGELPISSNNTTEKNEKFGLESQSTKIMVFLLFILIVALGVGWLMSNRRR